MTDLQMLGNSLCKFGLVSTDNDLSPKNRYQSRHCAYKTYSVKPGF